MTTFFQGGAAMQLLRENDFIDDGPFTIDDIFTSGGTACRTHRWTDL